MVVLLSNSKLHSVCVVVLLVYLVHLLSIKVSLSLSEKQSSSSIPCSGMPWLGLLGLDQHVFSPFLRFPALCLHFMLFSRAAVSGSARIIVLLALVAQHVIRWLVPPDLDRSVSYPFTFFH